MLKLSGAYTCTDVESRNQLQNMEEHRKSVVFLSKAARFFTVGASGLVINFLFSIILSNGSLASLWYIQATAIGILFL